MAKAGELRGGGGGGGNSKAGILGESSIFSAEEIFFLKFLP